MRKKLLLVASLFLTMSLVGCNGTPAPESKGTGTDESQHSAPIAETSNNENKSLRETDGHHSIISGLEQTLQAFLHLINRRSPFMVVAKR